MNKKYIKFTAANICTMILLLFTLLSHYSLIGLISFLVGSVILFLGTLLDNNKTEFGVSNKFSFTTFISVLILFGMWLPKIFEQKFLYKFGTNINIWGAIISFVLFFAFSMASTSERFVNYVMKRCFKYAGLAALLYCAYCFLSISLTSYPIVLIAVIVFLLSDIYSFKNNMYKTSHYSDTKPDKAYWMAFLIGSLWIIGNIISPSYFSLISQSNELQKTFAELLSGYNVPLFVMLMVVLTGIFMFADNISITNEAADSFLTLSLAGFCISLRTYFSFSSVETFIILVASIILYLVFGFSIVSMDKAENTYPIYALLKKNCYAPLIISISITLFTVLSIIFVKAGYLIPLITLICGVTLALVARKIFNGFWIAETMRWQMILIAIAAFTISIAFVNKNVNDTLTFIILSFVISSISMWALGIRDGVWDNRFTVSKVIDCVLMGVISLLALI